MSKPLPRPRPSPRAVAPDRTSVYRFDASLKVLHDMITPDRDGQRVDLVYPVLIGLMSGS